MSCEHDFFYYMATNEDGWKCCGCGHKPGEPPGFSPRLDRSEIGRKVYGVLSDLVDHDFIHVSNGSHGDAITSAVADRCQEAKRFDQYSIVLFIVEGMAESHAKYWREVSEGVLAGKDPRNRCPCGALSNSSASSGGGGPWTYRCPKHDHEQTEEQILALRDHPQTRLPMTALPEETTP